MADDRRAPATNSIINKLSAHEVAELERYAALETRLENIEKNMEEMLDMWKGAKGVLAFLKWAAAVGSTIAAITIWAKDHIK